MANKFPFYITALDNTAKVFSNMRKNATGLTQSFRKIGGSISTIKRESGWNEFSRDLTQARSDALDMANSLGTIFAPLGALMGAGSFMAIRNYTDEWAKLGRQMTLTAQQTGIPIQQIRAFEGAGQMAGLGIDTVDSALQSFNQTLESAAYGRDNGALAMFNRQGIDVMPKGAKWGDQARNSADVLREMADKYHNILGKNPAAATAMISSFGLGPLAPMLSGGHESIDKAMAIVKRFGYQQTPAMIAQANELAMAQFRVTTQFRSFGDEIATVTTPEFLKLNNVFSSWMEKNQQVLALNIGTSFNHIAQNVTAVAKSFYNAGEYIGLWKTDADAVVKFIEGTMIVSVLTLTAQVLKMNAAFLASPLGRMVTIISLVASTYENPTWAIDLSNEAMLSATEHATGMKRRADYKPAEYNGSLGDMVKDHLGEFLGYALNPGGAFGSALAGKMHLDVTVSGPPGTAARITSTSSNVSGATVVHNGVGSTAP